VNRQRLADQLIVDGGLKLKPYRCTAGRLTIGVGRNLDDRGITRGEALFLLGNDIDDCWARLLNTLAWLENAPEPVQEALTNMAFNLGVAGLLEFRQTLAALAARDYAGAARLMLASKWARQVGPRAARLAQAVKSAG